MAGHASGPPALFVLTTQDRTIAGNPVPPRCSHAIGRPVHHPTGRAPRLDRDWQHRKDDRYLATSPLEVRRDRVSAGSGDKTYAPVLDTHQPVAVAQSAANGSDVLPGAPGTSDLQARLGPEAGSVRRHVSAQPTPRSARVAKTVG